jgi:hypothetical protein
MTPMRARDVRSRWPAGPEVSPFRGVTARPSPHSIWVVTSRSTKTLTKRRAVDFCHVATAICPRMLLS